MNDLPQDNSAAAGQQDLEKHQTAASQPRLESSKNSEGRIILKMGKSSNFSAPVNGPSASTPLESTEKSDIPKEVKSRRSRKTKATSTPPPPRRSTRRNTEMAKDENLASTEQSQSSQATETLTINTKSKSRATPKSTSPPPASTNSMSSRSTKRKAMEIDETESLASTYDGENQLSQKSTGTTGTPAKKQKQQKSQHIQSTSPLAPTRFSKRKVSSSKKDVTVPVFDNQNENAPKIPSSVVSDNENLNNDYMEQQKFTNSQDPLNDPPEDEDDEMLSEPSPPRSKSPPDAAFRASSNIPKRKASVLEDYDPASNSQAIIDDAAQEVPNGDGPPFKRSRHSSSASSSSSIRRLRIGDSKAIVNEATYGEVNDDGMEASDAAVEVQSLVTKKRGRPAGGRPAASRQNSKPTKAATSALKKPGPAGRKKRTSKDAKVQASFDRMAELRKSYKEVAKGLKPTLALIADRTVESMVEDPKAHEKVPGHQDVLTGLDSILNAVVTAADRRYLLDLWYAEKKLKQEDELSTLRFNSEWRDIKDRTNARAMDAFVKTYDAGTREELVGDDNVSIDENRSAHFRDLHDFAVTSVLDFELPGTSTPRKSPSKKRGQNDSSLSEVIPGAAPIARHSLLAVTQEHEPSSMTSSRAATPEPLDNGKFDDYGVHIPNKIRRGRAVAHPNNRAVVQSWIEYDPWDIQHEVMASQKKPKDPSAKIDLIYLDQTSFTNIGGGGYKLSANRPDDFDQEKIKLYGLHPSYGIPTKDAKNPDGVEAPTDFSQRLDETRPVVVIDVEETRPVSPGGTRKPAELSEPLELSRSTSLVYANRNFEAFEVRQRMAKLLDVEGAGSPSVKGFATYDGLKRAEQEAADTFEDILEAAQIDEENEAKKATAAAAAAAANIAHKSSINAIVNSNDAEGMSGTISQANKQYQPRLNSGVSHGQSSVLGFDALSEAIDIKNSQSLQQSTAHRPLFSGPQTRDYGNQPRDYVSQEVYHNRNMQQPQPQQYFHRNPIQQQYATIPQQVGPYHNSALPQSQQLPPYSHSSPYNNNNGHPTVLQHQMMQSLQPNRAPAVPSPYSFQPPAPPQAMAPPRAYQFNPYVPPHLRQPEQPQAPPRPHREIRPAPPQNGTEWVGTHQPDTVHFYQNASPVPPLQNLPHGHGHYHNPTALTWPPHQHQHQQHPMQQGPPPSQAQQPPPHSHAPQNPVYTGPTAEFPPSSLPAYAAPTEGFHGEGESSHRNSTSQNPSKRTQ